MEYMQEDYPGRKTCRKNAPNDVKTVPKWLILGQNAWRTQVGQMMVLNGIHAGGHKQKSAIGNCWGIQCINTLCLFLTSIISHFSDAYIPFNAPVHAWRKNGKYDVCLVTGVHAFCVLHSFVYHHLFNFQGARPKKNIPTGETSQDITCLTIINFINTQLSSIDNFHQQTTFIKGQIWFASINNFHPHSPEPHQSRLQKPSSSHQSSLQKLS